MFRSHQPGHERKGSWTSRLSSPIKLIASRLENNPLSQYHGGSRRASQQEPHEAERGPQSPFMVLHLPERHVGRVGSRERMAINEDCLAILNGLPVQEKGHSPRGEGAGVGYREGDQLWRRDVCDSPGYWKGHERRGSQNRELAGVDSDGQGAQQGGGWRGWRNGQHMRHHLDEGRRHGQQWLPQGPRQDGEQQRWRWGQWGPQWGHQGPRYQPPQASPQPDQRPPSYFGQAAPFQGRAELEAKEPLQHRRQASGHSSHHSSDSYLMLGQLSDTEPLSGDEGDRAGVQLGLAKRQISARVGVPRVVDVLPWRNSGGREREREQQQQEKGDPPPYRAKAVPALKEQGSWDWVMKAAAGMVPPGSGAGGCVIDRSGRNGSAEGVGPSARMAAVLKEARRAEAHPKRMSEGHEMTSPDAWMARRLGLPEMTPRAVGSASDPCKGERHHHKMDGRRRTGSTFDWAKEPAIPEGRPFGSEDGGSRPPASDSSAAFLLDIPSTPSSRFRRRIEKRDAERAKQNRGPPDIKGYPPIERPHAVQGRRRSCRLCGTVGSVPPLRGLCTACENEFSVPGDIFRLATVRSFRGRRARKEDGWEEVDGRWQRASALPQPWPTRGVVLAGTEKQDAGTAAVEQGTTLEGPVVRAPLARRWPEQTDLPPQGHHRLESPTRRPMGPREQPESPTRRPRTPVEDPEEVRLSPKPGDAETASAEGGEVEYEKAEATAQSTSPSSVVRAPSREAATTTCPVPPATPTETTVSPTANAGSTPAATTRGAVAPGRSTADGRKSPTKASTTASRTRHGTGSSTALPGRQSPVATASAAPTVPAPDTKAHVQEPAASGARASLPSALPTTTTAAAATSAGSRTNARGRGGSRSGDQVPLERSHSLYGDWADYYFEEENFRDGRQTRGPATWRLGGTTAITSRRQQRSKSRSPVKGQTKLRYCEPSCEEVADEGD